VVDQLPLELEFSIAAASILDFDLMESSFDLMNNPLFQMAKRANWMMPTPYVLNDAVVIKQKIKSSPKIVKPIVLKVENAIQKDSLVVEKDSLRKAVIICNHKYEPFEQSLLKLRINGKSN